MQSNNMKMSMKNRKENAPKDKSLKKVKPSKAKFYATQGLKTALVLLIAFIPLNMKDEFIRILNRSTNVKESDVLPLTAQLDFLNLLSAISIVAGVVFVIVCINWSFHKYEVRQMRKEQEKVELAKYYADKTK